MDKALENSNSEKMLKNKNKITIYNIASTIILQGLAFFSGPIFSGLLGTDNYGIASVYLTWVQIASTVFSLQAAGTIAVARINFSEEEQIKYQSSVMSLSTLTYICFSVITIVVAVLARSLMDVNPFMIGLGLLQGWGMYCVTAINMKFTYEFKADKNFILSVSVSALTIGLSIFLIHIFPAESNYWGRIIGQSSVYTVFGTIIMLCIINKGKTVFNKVYWKFTLPLCIPMVFHLLAGIVLNQSDKIMIQGMLNNSAAGIYALACTFGAVLQTLWNALNNSWVPFYYDYTQNKQITEMKKHARNYIELFTIVTMGFILLSREVFHIYAKQSFWDGTDLIPLFSIGYYFIFLYSFPVNYEFYNKKTKTIAFGTTSAAICNIILNYFFIKLWGIQGAVIATAISHGLQFGFHFISAKRINPGSFPFRLLDFVPGFLVICITSALYWFTRRLYLVRWAICIVIGCYLLTKIIKRREIF